VTDKSQVEKLAQQVLKDLGRVDILVNNAGMKPIPHMEAAEVVDAVNVNLLSHYWVSNLQITYTTLYFVGFGVGEMAREELAASLD
jgi:NAD(P)-dependent dehydrogenase (short-subunit alcohol dehydrogenase family)